jgi:hypothetical protein
VWACDEREERDLERSGLGGFSIRGIEQQLRVEVVEIAAGGRFQRYREASRVELSF